jgi:serine phosphatase RsbU (regulator of sigma subunit)/anti-sigma regulatory factor (Ser/Thr protein kinase)
MVAENKLILGLTYSESAQCDFPADLALVPEVAGKLRLFCLRHGLDPESWPPVELALVEGLNNAIEHGCRGASTDRIHVQWHWSGEELEISILDPGQFRPALAAARLPDPLSERGRGTFVMASIMDSVTHTEQDGQHRLVLRKRLGPAQFVDSEAEAALDGMTADLSNSYETIAALFHFGEALATVRSFDDFAKHAAQRLLKLVGGDEACLRLGDNHGRLKLVSHECTRHGSSVPESLGTDDDAVEIQVLRTSEEQTIEECSKLQPHDPLRRQRGSAFVRPILFRDSTLGVLSVVRGYSNAYFTAGEIRLIGTVADFLGIARTMAVSQEHRQAQQRVERELEIAAEIQRSLLPDSYPGTGKFRIFGMSQAAEVVGGDYFDVLPVGEHGVLVVIADVMGKGVSAALLAMILRTTIRAYAALAPDPGHLLSVLNRLLCADLDNLGMFITAQIAYLSGENDELVFASAGHCPLLICSQDVVSTHTSAGEEVPLGVLEEVKYESRRETLASGDRLIFLSDGVYETESADGAMLGLDALVGQIPALCRADPRTDCRRLLDYVAGYAAGTTAADDRTLLIVQRR